MNVTENNFDICFEILKRSDFLSWDTETTSLNSFQDGRLFSVIISCEQEDFYFNFKDYPEENVCALPAQYLLKLVDLAQDNLKINLMQNAKFDMHMLAREGIFFAGKIYDTAVLDRVHFNQHMRYNLAEITKRWGDEKLDIVWKYIEENKLKTKTHHERFNKTVEQPHFDRVPFSIIQPYGEQDGASTLNVGKQILAKIQQDDQTLDPRIPKQMQVVENEARLTKTLFNMEHRGIQLDLDYCNEALDHYLRILQKSEIAFKNLTGLDFVKGTTVFEEVFASEKDKWEKTEKGNWKWDADVLETFENPSAKLAIEWAEAKKQSEYFANFLFYCDSKGVLHPDFQQGGTVTGRLSCRDPNLQNLTNPDKYEEQTEAALYPVRRSFIPRPGYFFAMIDFQQVEFRLALDYANANSLIAKVLDGYDVHTATAEVANISRKEAKTVNFLSIYGGGVVKLAQNLYGTKGSKAQLGAIYKKMFGWRLSDEEQRAWTTVTDELRQFNEPVIRKAYDVQQSVFRAAPEIKDFLKAVQRAAETRGYVRNYLGRRYYFTDKRWSYKAPNHLIQGSAADIIKTAMNRVDEYLKDKESKLLLSIHDELIIEVKNDEEFVINEIKNIMEGIWINRRLPLLVDVEISRKNMADKEGWNG